MIVYICRQDCFSYCLFPPVCGPTCLSLANHPVHSPTWTGLLNCRTAHLLAYLLPFLLRLVSFLYFNLFLSDLKLYLTCFFGKRTENQTRLILFSDILTVKENRRIEGRMIWVKTDPERSPISFSKSALFSSFIWHYNMLKPHNRGPAFPPPPHCDSKWAS